MAKNNGKQLEKLVAWIEAALRQDTAAVVRHNERIPDKDTGEARQIDVTIRIPNGHDEMLIIIEARDRGTPADVRFVEEMDSKRKSVGADVVYLVSRLGFTDPAKAKAKALNVRLLRLADAPDYDWSGWCRFRTIEITVRQYRNASITLIRAGLRESLPISKNLFETPDAQAKLITDADGTPIMSLNRFIRGVIRHEFEVLPRTGMPEWRTVKATLTPPHPAHILNADGVYEWIAGVEVHAELWHDISQATVAVKAYEKIGADGDITIAEIAEATANLGSRSLVLRVAAEPDGQFVKAGKPITLSAEWLPGAASVTHSGSDLATTEEDAD